MRAIAKGKGAVAAGHAETAAAAQVILEEGGNAFDAVLAAMIAACLAEPVLASMGGGGFMVARPATGKTGVYDFFAHTPKAHPAPDMRDFYPVTCDFGAARQQFHVGMASIAVPGAVKGLFEISRDLGRMPIKRIVEPALVLARDGIPVTPVQASIFKIAEKIYLSSAESRAIFASATDASRIIGAGEIMTNVAFADVLEAIAIEGDDLFYRGEIAERIAGDCYRGGGTVTRRDLESYEVCRRHPLNCTYKGTRIVTNPPPSSGGVLVAFALAMLEEMDMQRLVPGHSGYISLLAKVMDLTNRARIEQGIHELEEHQTEQTLLDPQLLESYRQEVMGQPAFHRGTTHISVIDRFGNAAALTLSNGEGAGYVVPGTGIMLNNMLGEEDINPHGFHQWPTDTRLSSMMAPAIVQDADGGTMVLGSGGSNRIRTAILQVLLNVLEFGMPLAAAIASPRIHFEGGLLNVEGGFDPDARQEFAGGFADVRSWDDKNMFFGGVHGVRVDRSGTYWAAGDERRGGAAVVL